MDVFLRLLGWADSLLSTLGKVSDWLFQPAWIPVGSMIAGEFVQTGLYLDLPFTGADMVLGGGLVLVLGFKIWKFVADGIGL